LEKSFRLIAVALPEITSIFLGREFGSSVDSHSSSANFIESAEPEKLGPIALITAPEPFAVRSAGGMLGCALAISRAWPRAFLNADL
jgi:hypothetical protein